MTSRFQFIKYLQSCCSLLYYICTYTYLSKGIPALIVGIAVGVAHDGYGNENK